MKEYLSKLESSIGGAVGIGAIAYLDSLPFKEIIPISLLGFLAGYFGHKFLINVKTTEQDLPK